LDQDQQAHDQDGSGGDNDNNDNDDNGHDNDNDGHDHGHDNGHDHGGVPPNPPDLRERRREHKRERSSRSRSRRNARRSAAGAAAEELENAIQNPDRDIRNLRLPRRERDAADNLNANANGNANANANANPANAALDPENEVFGILRDQDADRARDAGGRVAAHRVDPGNHVSVSDDETGNFNERFLQRIKKHMKASKRKNSAEQRHKKKKTKDSSLVDSFARGLDGRQRKMVFNDAGAVLEELIKLTSKVTRSDDAEDDDNCKKNHERDGKPSSHNAENVNDDESDEEDVDIDAQYVEALNLLDSSTVMPTQLLWGGIDDRQGSTLSRKASGNDDNDDDNDSDISDIPPAGESSVPRARKRKGNEGSKGGGGDNDRNPDEDNDNDDDSKGPKNVVEIPRTWLSAGFNLSDCGSGLALSKPDDTELARLKSMQSTLFPPGSSTVPPLPPFHCGGITMLTSLVTALLYSGVSIQGKEINCNAAKRKAFAQLTIDEKKKQFTCRLADALSAILFVAGETSTNFRLQQLADISKKLERRQESKRDGYNSDEEREKQYHLMKDRAATERVMETRAMLCRVCRWDEIGENKDLEPLDKDPLKMQVSLTNRHDLKAFVVANLRSFMAPGGCALFLETVIYIHGPPRVNRMLCEARGIENKNIVSPFITCNCEKKLKEEWDDFLKKRKVDASIRQKDWSEPLCRDCVAPELLSILLTGKPHVNMKDWVADNFGIGILSGAIVEEEGSVNARLISPQQPVWMVEGEKSYSVLWNEDKETNADALGQDSFSFKVNCWNCWDEDQERDVYRIIPGKRTPSSVLAEGSDPITKMEVDQTIVNPDDKLNYKDFRRWRYAFDSTQGDDSSKLSKPIFWVPLYNLTDRQKEIVLRKNALNIQLAVWSKWPNAHVQDAENNHPKSGVDSR